MRAHFRTSIFVWLSLNLAQLLVCSLCVYLPTPQQVPTLLPPSLHDCRRTGGSATARRLTPAVRFRNHNLDVCEIVPGLVVLAHPQRYGPAADYLSETYGSDSSSCVRLFDVEATPVRAVLQRQ